MFHTLEKIKYRDEDGDFVYAYRPSHGGPCFAYNDKFISITECNGSKQNKGIRISQNEEILFGQDKNGWHIKVFEQSISFYPEGEDGNIELKFCRGEPLKLIIKKDNNRNVREFKEFSIPFFYVPSVFRKLPKRTDVELELHPKKSTERSYYNCDFGAHFLYTFSKKGVCICFADGKRVWFDENSNLTSIGFCDYSISICYYDNCFKIYLEDISFYIDLSKFIIDHIKDIRVKKDINGDIVESFELFEEAKLLDRPNSIFSSNGNDIDTSDFKLDFTDVDFLFESISNRAPEIKKVYINSIKEKWDNVKNNLNLNTNADVFLLLKFALAEISKRVETDPNFDLLSLQLLFVSNILNACIDGLEKISESNGLENLKKNFDMVLFSFDKIFEKKKEIDRLIFEINDYEARLKEDIPQTDRSICLDGKKRAIMSYNECAEIFARLRQSYLLATKLFLNESLFLKNMNEYVCQLKDDVEAIKKDENAFIKEIDENTELVSDEIKMVDICEIDKNI